MSYNFMNSLRLCFDQECQGSLRHRMEFQLAFIGQLQKRLGRFAVSDNVTGNESRCIEFLDHAGCHATTALGTGADYGQIAGMTGAFVCIAQSPVKNGCTGSSCKSAYRER